MKKVAVIHPWFPRYRLEFFELLVERAAAQDIQVQIFHGDPPPEWRARGDAVSARWATSLPTKFFRLGRKSLVMKSLRPVCDAGPFDLYIVEHAIRSLETYLLINRHPSRVALWGHGRTYTQPVGALQEYAKKLLLRWSRWYFAYTKGGALAVASTGYPRDQITVVQNSIDTRKLRSELEVVTSQEVYKFRTELELDNSTAIFIGGLDNSKRLDFLFAACSLVARRVPGFRLVVAGDGDQRALVEKWTSEAPWMRFIGPVNGAEKAVALRAAEVMCMPGRVGLVAVDSFAAATPIVTTNWPYHAPEYEYLQSGVNALITENDVESYAVQLADLLTDDARLELLTEGCRSAASKYSVEQMVDNFLEGLTQVLDSVAP